MLVVERDGHQADGLTGRLRELGVEHVQAVPGVGAPLSESLPGPPDLVFCRLDAGEGRGVEILHQIAGQTPPAAVAIYGPLADPAHAEDVCRRLGLRYLGHLPPPIQQERLRRLVRHLRAFLCRPGIS